MATEAMSPAVSAGDHIVMEGVSFIARPPRRGDVIVFKTDGIPSLPPGHMYSMRVAGEPGDHVQILEGKLLINGKHVTLRNYAGEIVYKSPKVDAFKVKTDLTVPSGCYLVLGDNSTNSFDSRFWGTVPNSNITGRISFCYWPPKRVGGVQ
jgi:signal peptidase I